MYETLYYATPAADDHFSLLSFLMAHKVKDLGRRLQGGCYYHLTGLCHTVASFPASRFRGEDLGTKLNYCKVVVYHTQSKI